MCQIALCHLPFPSKLVVRMNERFVFFFSVDWSLQAKITNVVKPVVKE